MKLDKKLAKNSNAKPLQTKSKESMPMSMYLTNTKSTNTSFCMINKSTNTQNINLPYSPVPTISVDVKELSDENENLACEAGVEDLKSEKEPQLPKCMTEEKVEPVEEKHVTKEQFLKLMAEFREQTKKDREDIFRDFWGKDIY